MDLLLIRHALPVRIEGGDGPADPELADDGWQQAGALAAWLADDGIDVIVASPLRRAQETAEPLATLLDLPVAIVDGLAEFDRDAPWYIPIEELKASNDPRWHAMLKGEWDLDPDQFRRDVVEAVDGIIAGNPGGTVAAVCHGGTINAYLSSVLGLDELMFFFPEYTSVSRVRASRSGSRSVVSVNETGHLRFAHRWSG